MVRGEVNDSRYDLVPIGHVRSTLKEPGAAPRQGTEGAPNAWLDIRDEFDRALDGLRVGQQVLIITWLHLARRDLLQVHPRDNPAAPLAGVFNTRSADRPNPLGLHQVRILQLSGNQVEVGPLEAVDGTPVLDIKPVLT